MDETTHHASPHGNSGRGHETYEINIRPLVKFLAVLFVSLSVVLLLMGWMFDYFATRELKRDVPPSPLATPQVPPEPRLRVVPGKELREVRAAEDVVLNTYAWVDQGAGIVRIPIDRAIEMLAERGLPVRPHRPGKD